MVLAIGYWGMLLPLGLLAYFAFPNDSWIAMPVFWGWMVIVWIASFATSKLSFKEWYGGVFLYGVRKLSRSMTKLSTPAENPNVWWVPVFDFWWGFSVKYFFPFAVWWLLCLSFANDIENPYAGNYVGWQVLGFLFPLTGILCFIIPVFMCTTPEPFDHNIMAAFDEDVVGTSIHPSKDVPAVDNNVPKEDNKEVEMPNIETKTANPIN